MRRSRTVAVVALVLAACGVPAETGIGLTTTAPPGLSTPSRFDEFLGTEVGSEYVSTIREAESLVVGDVFTLVMSDQELVAFGVALCELQDQTGDAVAVARDVVERLDWRQPANGEMVVSVHGAALAGICDAGLPSSGLPLDAIVVPRSEDTPMQNVDDVDATIQAFIDSAAGQAFLTAVRLEEARLSPVFTETLSDADLVHLARGICQTEAELGGAAAAEHDRYLEAYGYTSVADVEMFDVLTDASAPVCATVG